MPHKPPKVCAAIGCSTVTLGRHCERHATRLNGFQHDGRESSTRRGYDYRWQKLRLWHMRQHPLCVACNAEGRVTAAELVDHIVPIAVDPTRRLDPTNLQSLCAPCHAAKTAADQRGGGAGRISTAR